MSIIKNEIPILEFDTEQTAVISPVHENLNLILPKKCVFAFLGEYIDEYAEKTGAQIVSYFIHVHKPLIPYKILKNLCFYINLSDPDTRRAKTSPRSSKFLKIP